MIRVDQEKVEDALRELADREMQHRLCLASSGEISSFTEVVCSPFDDSGLGDALDRGEAVYGAQIDAGLRKLHRVIRVVSELRAPADLLMSTEMETVRRVAAEMLVLIQGRQ